MHSGKRRRLRRWRSGQWGQARLPKERCHFGRQDHVHQWWTQLEGSDSRRQNWDACWSLRRPSWTSEATWVWKDIFLRGSEAPVADEARSFPPRQHAAHCRRFDGPQADAGHAASGCCRRFTALREDKSRFGRHCGSTKTRPNWGHRFRARRDSISSRKFSEEAEKKYDLSRRQEQENISHRRQLAV